MHQSTVQCKVTPCQQSLITKQQAHSGNCPLCSLFLGLEVEGPHKGEAPLPRLVHWTLVDVFCLLLVHGDGPNEDDRHGRSELFKPGLLDETRLGIPPGPLHEQPVHVGTFPRGAGEVLAVLLGHVTLQAHLVQRPLVLSRHGLHDGRQEGLRVEEPGQPDAGWHVEVAHPGFQVLDPEQQVGIPGSQSVQRRVRSLGPALWHAVEVERILEVFHIRCNRQFTLKDIDVGSKHDALTKQSNACNMHHCRIIYTG